MITSAMQFEQNIFHMLLLSDDKQKSPKGKCERYQFQKTRYPRFQLTKIYTSTGLYPNNFEKRATLPTRAVPRMRRNELIKLA